MEEESGGFRVADLSRLRGPSCPVCGGDAVRRPGGVLFCYACGPQALEELVARAYVHHLITLQDVMTFLGMGDSTVALEFVDAVMGRKEGT